MKRLFVFLLTLLLVCAMPLCASADVLWEPMDNAYYWDNYENAETIAMKYVVPEGMTVNIYSSPEGGKLLKTLEAGTRVYVGISVEIGGETWAVGYPLGDFDTEGWFRLSRLQREYDHELFMEEFGSQVTNADINYDVETITEDIPTWTYPGSGVSDGVIEAQWMNTDYNDGKLTIDRVYTDAEGGQWGYVGYYMGHYGWAYLTDLHDPEPPTFPQEAENTVTDTSPTEDVPASASLSVILVLVGIVILVTGITIITIKKRSSR